MYAKTRILAAALSLIALAACSPGDEPSVVSEASASTPPASNDYGWRSPESTTAMTNDTAFEYY